MSATPEAKGVTRAFARVIGPFLVIVPGIIAMRASEMDALVSAFFENGALVWIVGGLLLFGGLLVIAHHQYWSSPAAILISLFGWFLALRGLALLVAPQLYQRGATGALGALPLVRIGFRCARLDRPLAHLRGLDRQTANSKHVTAQRWEILTKAPFWSAA